jgi:hypothetical protein
MGVKIYYCSVGFMWNLSRRTPGELQPISRKTSTIRKSRQKLKGIREKAGNQQVYHSPSEFSKQED